VVIVVVVLVTPDSGLPPHALRATPRSATVAELMESRETDRAIFEARNRVQETAGSPAAQG
jgi:hypothetical protein